MTEDAAAGYIPGAAEDYHFSGDGLTHTFRIRDHCWSDDMPVTADDFVYSFRRAQSEDAAQYASLLYPIANAEAVNAGHASLEALGVRTRNARTLEIRFAIEVLYMEELLSHTWTYPVPRHVIAHHGDNSWTNPCVLIGNGPYKLSEWIPNEYVGTRMESPVFTTRPVSRFDARSSIQHKITLPRLPAFARASSISISSANEPVALL
jgi:oligopeptide transport system substrate-binding protein